MVPKFSEQEMRDATVKSARDANTITSKIGIYLILFQIKFLSESESPTLNGINDENMEKINAIARDMKENKKIKFDAAIYLTGQAIGTYGYYDKSKLCKSETGLVSAGLVTLRGVGRTSSDLLAVYISHVIGLGIGLHEDFDTKCTDRFAECKNCVMYNPRKADQRDWSECSRADIGNFTLQCTISRPKNMETEGFEICGNGVIEGSEACDFTKFDMEKPEIPDCCEPETCHAEVGTECGNQDFDDDCNLGGMCSGLKARCEQSYRDDDTPCKKSDSNRNGLCKAGICKM